MTPKEIYLQSEHTERCLNANTDWKDKTSRGTGTDIIKTPTCLCAQFLGEKRSSDAEPWPPTTSAQSATEAVDHPSHYGGDTLYEVIKVIEAWGLNFNLGTAVKYIPRAGKKDPLKHIEDLEKSVWYLQREIQKLRGEPI